MGVMTVDSGQRRRVTRVQPISRCCMLCGTDNRFGLRARYLELDDGQVMAIVQPRPEHQGYPGRMHGGIAGAILDELIGRTINVTEPDVFGVTVELSVKYRQPVPLDRELRAVARLTKDGRRMYEGTGELLADDGSVAVEAWARYLRQPVATILDGDASDFEGDWLLDDREAPDTVEI